jgi:hypothetical protein
MIKQKKWACHKKCVNEALSFLLLTGNSQLQTAPLKKRILNQNFQNYSEKPQLLRIAVQTKEKKCTNSGAIPSGLFFYSQIGWVKTRVDGRICCENA